MSDAAKPAGKSAPGVYYDRSSKTIFVNGLAMVTYNVALPAYRPYLEAKSAEIGVLIERAEKERRAAHDLIKEDETVGSVALRAAMHKLHILYEAEELAAKKLKMATDAPGYRLPAEKLGATLGTFCFRRKV